MGFGPPTISPWKFRLSECNVLDILWAPSLPIFRPKIFKDAHLSPPLEQPEFSRVETDTGFAGVVIYNLLSRLWELGILPSSAPADIEPKLAKRFAATLAALDRLLHYPAIETLYRDWKTMLTGPEDLEPPLIPFDVYMRSTKVLARYAGVSAEGAASAERYRRELKHNSAGSAQERFIRQCLVPAFDEIYREKPVARRRTDGVVAATPFLAFATAFYKAIGGPRPSDETIYRTRNTATEGRRRR